MKKTITLTVHQAKELYEEDEIWKDIPSYEGLYQSSEMGRVRSLDRIVVYSDGRKRLYKGQIIEGSLNTDGYRQLALSKNGNCKTFMVSQVIAITFLKHKPNGLRFVVDHIDGDKLNNRVKNLRIVTHRENVSTCFRINKDSLSSKYVGVSFDNINHTWVAKIYFNGIYVNIGSFKKELEASNAYQLALSKINNKTFKPDDYKPEWTSKYKGVFFRKESNRWLAQIRIDKKQKHIGTFLTEDEAYKAYMKYKLNNNI